jgi:hypothetical protein
MVLAVSTSASYGASFWSSLRNAFRQDIKATKQAIKTDIENSKKAQAKANEARKKESLKEVNAKIDALNKEMRAVKADKNITETERVIRTRALQKQIDLYKKQKKDIQKW